MSVREEFDAWAADGRDRGMEQRHWHTAKHVLARMPVDPGDAVLDLGCGSGYAARALVETRDAGRAYGLDGAPEMTRNARSYTDADLRDRVAFLRGDFEDLPFDDDSLDHCFSMEAELGNNDSNYSGATPTVSRVPSSRYRSTIASRVSKPSVGNSDSGGIPVS